MEVRTRDVSLADGGAAPAPPEESKEKDGKDKKKKKKAFDNKVPKALLEFHDVSNGADGEYEVGWNPWSACSVVVPLFFCVQSTVAWGSPAPIDSLKEAVRSTLNSKVKAAVTDAVATVVSEFMTK